MSESVKVVPYQIWKIWLLNSSYDNLKGSILLRGNFDLWVFILIQYTDDAYNAQYKTGIQPNGSKLLNTA